MPFIKTKVETSVDAPTGATMSPDGNLVIGQMGEINVENDSLLTYYDPKDGKLVKNFKTDLHDLIGPGLQPQRQALWGRLRLGQAERRRTVPARTGRRQSQCDPPRHARQADRPRLRQEGATSTSQSSARKPTPRWRALPGQLLKFTGLK